MKNINMINIKKIPVIMPNMASSMYVTKSGVLNDFLSILNMSKSIPMNIPQSMYIAKYCIWLIISLFIFGFNSPSSH